MQTFLKEFIRNEDTKQPRGLVVAIRENGQVHYGYSLLNTKLDRFDKTLGLQIATNRALNPEGFEFPDTAEREALVVEALGRIEARALKYFKDLDPAFVKLFQAEAGEGTSVYTEA
jgi:hypothetical protein